MSCSARGSGATRVSASWLMLDQGASLIQSRTFELLEVMLTHQEKNNLLHSLCVPRPVNKSLNRHGISARRRDSLLRCSERADPCDDVDIHSAWVPLLASDRRRSTQGPEPVGLEGFTPLPNRAPGKTRLTHDLPDHLSRRIFPGRSSSLSPAHARVRG